MIHLDCYEFDGRTFLRTWDDENPDTILESVERPPLRITEVLETSKPEYGLLRDLLFILVMVVCGALVICAPYLIGN